MEQRDNVTRRDVLRTGGAAFLVTSVAGCDLLAAEPEGGGKPAAEVRANARRKEEVVVVAAGDIACPLQIPPHERGCRQEDTAALVESLRPDAVLALGDLQYEHGSLANFLGSYDRSWGRFKAITHPVMGDHEFAPDGSTGYFDYFGKAAGEPGRGYYSFDLGAWHLVALNSECRAAGGCEPDSPQDRWLRADLAAHRDRHTLAFFQNPLFSSGVSGPSPAVRTFWRRLYAAGAEMVLSGNDHDYERFARQDPDGNRDIERGITQFVVGTGGMSLTPVVHLDPNSVIHHDTTFGVLELVLRRGDFSWSFHSIDGGPPLDSGTQPCH